MNREDVRYRLEMDMRYGNQLVTTAVSFDINRVNGVADVLHLIKTFSENFGERDGAGTQAPEAGIRVNTIRVTSFVEDEVVEFNAIGGGEDTTEPAAMSSRGVPFPGVEDAAENPVYNEEALRHEFVIHGPAIVTTGNTTYLVEPGWRLEPHERGGVWLLAD